MIVQNQRHSMGAKVAEIHSEMFHITITTAKEGLFKGLSTVIIDRQSGILDAVGKVLWAEGIGNSDRRLAHDALVEGLNEYGDARLSLHQAMKKVFEIMERRGLIKEAINIAGNAEEWLEE